MRELNNTLLIITARGGSKGIPGKNIKPLLGKPLLNYTLEVARALVPDDQICLSTDSDEIIAVATKAGLNVPFKRPEELALDTSGTYDVLIHAIKYYQSINKNYRNIILLQPTSPFRTTDDIRNAYSLFTYGLDMVVSVNRCLKDPYYNLYEENEKGYIVKSQKEIYRRRQDSPTFYEYNGAIYIINTDSLLKEDFDNFTKVKKYVMDPLNSIDIDTMEDWEWAEYLIKKKRIILNKF